MKQLALALAIGVLATLPLWVGNVYYVNIASQILLYAVFALGLNVLVGYAGLVSLGHAGLFGIAAYAGALAINRAPTILSRSSRRSPQRSPLPPPSRYWRCAALASVS